MFLVLVYTLPFFASSPPSDDREAVKAHRRVSGGQSRSKCAARVRRANIELVKAEMTERQKTHKIAFSLAYVKKKQYLCSRNFCVSTHFFIESDFYYANQPRQIPATAHPCVRKSDDKSDNRNAQMRP